MPLGVRSSALRLTDVLDKPLVSEPDLEPTDELSAVAAGGEQPWLWQEGAGLPPLRWSGPTELLARSAGAARALDALMAPAPELAKAEPFDGEGAGARLGPGPADSRAAAAILGPRLGLDLDTRSAGLIRVLWGGFDDDRATATLGGARTLRRYLAEARGELFEALAQAEEFHARVTELQGDRPAMAGYVVRWPEDAPGPRELLATDMALAAVALLRELDPPVAAAGEPSADSIRGASFERRHQRSMASESSEAAMTAPRAERSAERWANASRRTELEAERDRPSRADVPRDGIGKPVWSPMRRSSGGPERSGVGTPFSMSAINTRETPSRGCNRSRRFRFHLWPRRAPEGDDLRRRKQELLRKALAEHRDVRPGGGGVAEHTRLSAPQRAKLTWKPGDPFAGWTKPPARRFRWHAMAISALLTAGSVASIGYAALRLLVATGGGAG